MSSSNFSQRSVLKPTKWRGAKITAASQVLAARALYWHRDGRTRAKALEMLPAEEFQVKDI
jgi:hypothetical protein